MKKIKLTAWVSLLLALTVFISVAFNGCGSTEPETTAPVSDTVSGDETTLPNEPETDSITSTTNTETTAVEQNSDEETTGSDAPESVAEIVAFFNKSANRIKTESTKVVKNYEKRTVNEDKVSIPKAVESAAEDMLASLMKDDTEPVAYTTRSDITTNFLVPNQSYVSKLDPAYVTSATCTDNGKEYIIHIKLKTQKSPTAGVGIGAVCDVIEAAEVADGAPFVEKFTTEYYNCEIRATIDKATGRVIAANYKTPLVLNITVNMLGTHDLSLGFTFEKDYTISY